MTIVRIFFAILIIGPILLGFFNLYRNREHECPDSPGHLPAMINSAVLYALSFNIIFFLQEVFLVLGKKAIGLTAYLYHNNHTWDGSHPMDSLMQGSGALAIFVIGLMFALVLQFLRTSNSTWKVFVIWMAFHGLVQSSPQVVIAFFAPNTDVGQALIGYLGFGEVTMVLLSVCSVLWTIGVCILFSRPLIELASANTDLSNPKARLRFARYVVAFAAIIGSFLIVPFRIPPMTQVIAPFFLLVVSMPWTWTYSGLMKNVVSVPNNINEKIQWVPIASLLLLLAFFQLVLAPGIKF